MQLTRQQLQEIMDKRIKSQVDSMIDEAMEPYTKVDPSKRPNDNDGEQTKGSGGRTSLGLNKQGSGKTYKKIFNKDYIESSEFDDYEDFLNAVKNGFDPRLKDMAGNVGHEGGFLLAEAFAEKIVDITIEDSIVMPRASLYGLKAGKGRTMRIPCFVDEDHSTAGIAGIDAVWTGEKVQKTKTDPIFRSLGMQVNKLVCYSVSSDELIQESGISLNEIIGNAFKKSILFKTDYVFLQGTGAGMPNGVLNSPALLVQPAESGQTASTINYDNIVGMFSKLAPASFKNAIWVASISALPEMMKLNIEVGLGGEHVRILQEENGRFYLLGKECIFSEKMPKIGAQGCLLLADFSAYAVLLKEGIRLESSIHEGFRSDLTSFRMILNVDGQTTINKPTILLDGSTEVSQFVCLGAVE
jgi:HK97 family phage major capsid protein